ncbi:MAG: FxLYD domain-containing protein [Clostridia bacterium]
MKRMKTFFIYAILVVAFFLFSQVMINFAIHTTYHKKDYKILTDVCMDVQVKATSVNGVVTGSLLNDTPETIENQYIKMDFYSKHDVLMGTKYVEVKELTSKEKQDFEIKFNYSKVDRVEIDLVNTISDEVTQEQKESDPTMNFAVLVTSIIFLCYFG